MSKKFDLFRVAWFEMAHAEHLFLSLREINQFCNKMIKIIDIFNSKKCKWKRTRSIYLRQSVKTKTKLKIANENKRHKFTATTYKKKNILEKDKGQFEARQANKIYAGLNSNEYEMTKPNRHRFAVK